MSIPWGGFTAWSAAFEAAIAAATHRLADRIANTPKYTAGRLALRRLSYQYGNAYAAGLLVTVAVSALANFGHAVESGQTFAIFAQYNVSPLLYSLAFGGILPLVSLLFARILADTTEGEAGSNPVLEQANQTIKQLKGELQSTEARAAEAETRATKAEQRFAAAGDVMIRLFAEEKRPRILADDVLFNQGVV